MGRRCLLLHAARDALRLETGGRTRWAGATESMFDWNAGQLQPAFRDSVLGLWHAHKEFQDQVVRLLTAWLSALSAFAGDGPPDELLQHAAEQFEEAWAHVRLVSADVPEAWSPGEKGPHSNHVRAALNDLISRSERRTGVWLVRDLMKEVLRSDESALDKSSWPLPIALLLTYEKGGKTRGTTADWFFTLEEVPVHGILPSPSKLGIMVLERRWQEALNDAWHMVEDEKILPDSRLARWWLSASRHVPLNYTAGDSAGAAFYCGLRARAEGKTLNPHWAMTGRIGERDKQTCEHPLVHVGGLPGKLTIATEEFRRVPRGVFLPPDQPEYQWFGESTLRIRRPPTLEKLYDWAQTDPHLELGVRKHHLAVSRAQGEHLDSIGFLEPDLLLAAKKQHPRIPDLESLIRPTDLEELPEFWKDASAFSPQQMVTLTDSVCIIAESGMGKTELTRWIQCTIARHAEDSGTEEHLCRYGKLVLRFEARAWPGSLGGYVEAVKDELRNAGQLAGWEEKVDQWAKELLLDGDVIVILDALDQQENEEDRDLVAILRQVLGRYSNSQVFVTSRPSGVVRYHELFDPQPDRGPWRFVRLQPFDRDQQKEYLGEHYRPVMQALCPVLADEEQASDWLDLIGSRVGIEWMGSPLILYVLREVARKGKLTGCRNRGEVYWVAMNDFMKRQYERLNDEEQDEIGARKDHPQRFLAAVAFEMISRGCWQASVFGDNYRQLLRTVIRRTGIPEKQCDEIVRQSSVHEYGLLEEWANGLAFRHRSIMEYYAGLWLARYAEPDDKTLAAQWKVSGDSEDLDAHLNALDYRSVLQFAKEIPK